MLLDLSDRLHSEDFAKLARHPDHPRAFTRTRKLPLPALVGALLCQRAQSQQVLLDAFFGSLFGADGLYRSVSDRAFAKARAHIHMPALVALNDFVLARAQDAGWVARWRGLRVVAADGSVLMPAIRPCHRVRSPAAADQRLFALYLPGAELMLHAHVYSAEEAERAQLVEALDKLAPGDVLVLDRGYPAAWLVSLLTERGIRFVMRCDNASGWAAAKAFLRSGADEARVTLNAPGKSEARDWECPATAPQVRLVRNVSTTGGIRVMVTNLSAQEVPWEAFGELYHQRWRIEEAFKRLKHRLHLEAVSGLTQQALIVDVAAKVLADNLASLMCAVAADEADLGVKSRKCNRAYAAQFLARWLPRVLLPVGDVLASINEAIKTLGATTQRFVEGRARPRPKHHVKPHKLYAYKG